MWRSSGASGSGSSLRRRLYIVVGLALVWGVTLGSNFQVVTGAWNDNSGIDGAGHGNGQALLRVSEKADHEQADSSLVDPQAASKVTGTEVAQAPMLYVVTAATVCPVLFATGHTSNASSRDAAETLAVLSSNVFDAWRDMHGKPALTPEEYAYRHKVWKFNVWKVCAHNARGDTWVMELNPFADLLAVEFGAAIRGGLLRGSPPLSVDKSWQDGAGGDADDLNDADDDIGNPALIRSRSRSRSWSRSRSRSRTVSRSATLSRTQTRSTSVSKTATRTPSVTSSLRPSPSLSQSAVPAPTRSASASPMASVPAAIDWTTRGAVTPVRNQGSCGSCWAFSAAGAIEGTGAIATGVLTPLSVQQLVDCSSSYGNLGCRGGLMDAAFQYVISTRGLCTDAAYPYTGVTSSCRAGTCSRQSQSLISAYVDVPSRSDGALAAAVAGRPVSVAIEADQSAFQLYGGGVLTAACGINIDHGVLAVGYGVASGVPYWKLKNSWGTSWGMAGYVLLARGSGYNGGYGQCGIYSMSSYPVMS